MAEDAVEEYMAGLAEKDKVEEKYRAINEDEPVKGLEFAWMSRVCGDTQQFTKGEGTISYAINVIKSMRWPGAVTVTKSGKYCNIYVGDGFKNGDSSYNPIVPPDV